MIAAFMGHELKKPVSGVFKGISHYKSAGFPKTYAHVRCSAYLGNSWTEYEVKKEFLPKELRYHKEWNWIMPVIEKINSLTSEAFSNQNNRSRYNELRACVNVAVGSVRALSLEHTYKNVVDFIEWYNDNWKEND